MATAFDIPRDVIQACQPQELTQLITHPSCGLEHCACSLLAHAGVIGRGGGEFIFKKREENETQSKCQRQELEAPELGVKEDQDDTGGEELNPEASGGQVQGSNNKPLPHKRKELPQEVANDWINQASDPLSDQMDKDQNNDRDLKAVKADDAEIPVWLWNDAIRQGLKVDPATRGHSVVVLDEALDVLRGFFLQKRFRLQVTQSFFDHWKEEYSDLLKPDRIEVQAQPLTAQEQAESLNGFVVKYSRRLKFGCMCYKGWYNNFWSQAAPDCAPGYNAIYGKLLNPAGGIGMRRGQPHSTGSGWNIIATRYPATGKG
jgi:hypothetical protein